MNIVKATRSENAVCEHQARIAQERILFIEKIFSELCSVSALYARKSAGVRDVTDELGKALQSYSSSERINKSLKQSLQEFSSTLAEIGDYRNLEVERLEKKVVQEFIQYETVCRNSKEEVKNIFSARDRELTWRKQLDKVKEKNPLNRQQITTAESELVKATAEVSRTQRALEEQMDIFEKKKLCDIKSILLDFVKIELSLNSKLIELLTRGYQEIMQIDEEEDLEDFQNEIKIPESEARLETVKKASLRHSSLLATLFSTPRKSQKQESNNENNPSQLTISSDLVESLKNSEEASESDENDDDDDESSVVSDENIPDEINIRRPTQK